MVFSDCFLDRSTEIYGLTKDVIPPVRYQDIEYFQVTKQFLNAPEQMIRYLENWVAVAARMV